MRAGVVLLVAWLLLIIALPLWALLSKSFQNAERARSSASPTTSAISRRRRCFGSILNSVGVAIVVTADRDPARVRLRLCADAQPHAVPAACSTRGALLPLFAPSLLSAISLIYLFGNQGLLKGLLFGGSIYGPIGIVVAQVFYCFPHALIIAVTALALADARLYEVADALGTSKIAHLPHRDAAGREVRPDQCGVRRVHAGGHRLRHRQGDRRPVQRAGDRRLQAGRRPAELPDGRGGRHGAAGAGRARLRHRPRRAAPAGRAALGARRAAIEPKVSRARDIALLCYLPRSSSAC